MKNEFSCATAQNLLPLSVDGLTSEETEAALQAHLAECADCRAAYAAMQSGSIGREVSVDSGKIFKKTRKKLIRNLILIVLALCAMFSGFYVFMLWYGSDSLLKVEDYAVLIEKIPLEDFLLVDAGGGDYLAHIADGHGDTSAQELFLLKAEDYQKLKNRGYAWSVTFQQNGNLKINDINTWIEDGDLRTALWSYHNDSLVGFDRQSDFEPTIVVYDDFDRVVNCDEKEQTNIVWMMDPAPVYGDEPG